VSNLKSQIATSNSVVPAERIERRILLIRGQKVILSTDLAQLYEVVPKVLMQAVKRNSERFPEDFMFQLTRVEYANLKSQIVTSSWGGARRATPYAFTESGCRHAVKRSAQPACGASQHRHYAPSSS
jgi:hypothetical protein